MSKVTLLEFDPVTPILASVAGPWEHGGRRTAGKVWSFNMTGGIEWWRNVTIFLNRHQGFRQLALGSVHQLSY